MFINMSNRLSADMSYLKQRLSGSLVRVQKASITAILHMSVLLMHLQHNYDTESIFIINNFSDLKLSSETSFNPW